MKRSRKRETRGGCAARDEAVALGPALQQWSGGALEATGVIVGGWTDATSEGHYGIRVWITGSDAARIGLV